MTTDNKRLASIVLAIAVAFLGSTALICVTVAYVKLQITPQPCK